MFIINSYINHDRKTYISLMLNAFRIVFNRFTHKKLFKNTVFYKEKIKVYNSLVKTIMINTVKNQCYKCINYFFDEVIRVYRVYIYYKLTFFTVNR